MYRIARSRFINDLSGEGARIYGGRWNSKGTSVLYSSLNRSLATLEVLANVTNEDLPVDLCIAEIKIFDNAEVKTVSISELPGDWDSYPAPLILNKFGNEWIKENKMLCLRVPSAVVKKEWNILLNPDHQQFRYVKITNIDEINFDNRLFK